MNRQSEGIKKTIKSLFNDQTFYTAEINCRTVKWKIEEHVHQFKTTIDDIKRGEARKIGTIIVSPRELTTKEKKDRGLPTSSMCTLYDLHDGKHRLVIVSLALAAERDAMEERHQNGDPDETANFEVFARRRDIAELIAPHHTSVRNTAPKKRATRILLQPGDALETILTHDPSGTADADEAILKAPKKNSTKDPNAKKIFDIYNFWVQTFRKMGPEGTEDFISKLLSQTWVTVTNYERTEDATLEVLDQSRSMPMKGIEFMALAFLNSGGSEPQDTRYATFNSFKELYQGKSSGEEKRVEDACLVLTKCDSARKGNTLALSQPVEVFRGILSSLEKGGKLFYDTQFLSILKVLGDFRRKPAPAAEGGLLQEPLTFFRTMSSKSQSRFHEVESVVVALRHYLKKEDHFYNVMTAMEPLAYRYWTMHQNKPEREKRCFKIS